MDTVGTESVQRLDSLRQAHVSVPERLFRVDPCLYWFDVFTIAAANRSLCLMKGFRTLLREHNFLAAAPLVRLELDTFLRYSAGNLVADRELFAENTLHGTSVRKQKDRSGKLMFDAHLLETVAEREPWLVDLYSNASGYVHLSEQHYLSAVTLAGPSRFQLKVSESDSYVTQAHYEMAAQAFSDVASLLLAAIDTWAGQRGMQDAITPIGRVR